jgi:predicted O-methyltransferase YrrM
MSLHPLVRRAQEFGAMQKAVEFSGLLALLEQEPLHTVVEIGTYTGGTLLCWCRLAEEQAVLVSVDLDDGPCGGPFQGGCSPERLDEMQRWFPSEQQSLHLLRRDSHDRSTLEDVENLLDQRPVDFLFIDGDHRYEGVKQDFEMYSPLVRSGGLIAFHDIMQPSHLTNPGVAGLWQEIKGGYRHHEFTEEPHTWGGIGVLWQK